MEFNLKVNIELTDEQRTAAICDPKEYFKKYFEKYGLNESIIKIIQVDIEREMCMRYGSYGFSNSMIEWLNSIGLYRIEEVVNFTYEQIKMSVSKNLFSCHRYGGINEYIPKLIKAMEMQGIIKFQDILISDLTPIETLGLSARILNALKKMGIIYTQDISLFTKNEISSEDNIGKKSLQELEEKMSAMGICFSENERNGIRNSIDADTIYLNAYGLSNVIIYWLNSVGIHRIKFLNNFTYTEFRLLYDDKNNNSFCFFEKKDLDLLFRAMKRFDVTFKDLDTNNLIPVSDCGLSFRTVNCLSNRKLFYLQDIAAFSRSEICKIRNFVKYCQKELDTELKKHGLWYKEE